MTLRPTSCLLLCAALAAAAIASSACSGSSTPGAHPTPSPTPFTPTNCQIAWFTAEAAPGKYDVYVVDMPAADWTSGTLNYGGAHKGLFYKGFNLSQTIHTPAALATAGTFLVTLSNGTATGSSLAFSDTGAQRYVTGVPGSVVGSGGTGSFHGVWSDPSPAGNPSFGAGLISLVYATTSYSLGADATMAICYSGTAFQSREVASMPVLERAGELLEARRAER